MSSSLPPAAREEISEILGRTIVSQHKASNPLNSAWVSANAGSGKTYVLAQRVVRLLLAGVAPSKILCLTFTKAAAAEMSNRVFKQLAGWGVLDDDALIEELKSAGETNPTPARLRRARLLFTRAMETPGGLKIQTIHAFCEALLHQFTLEANTCGHFDVMGDYDHLTLLEKARQSALAATLEQPELASALAAAMQYGKDPAIEKGLDQIIHNRQGFTNWLRMNNDSPAEAIASTGRLMGVDTDECEADLAARLLSQLPISEARLRELGIAAGHLDFAKCQSFAKAVAAIDVGKTNTEKFALRLKIYQTGKKKFIKNPPSIGALYKLIGGSKELIEAEFEAIKPLAEEYANWKMLRGSQGLFELANCVLDFYAKSKRSRGLLDYDDLINRTADLLARSDVRQWIQYKLDAGIDHVLVDEAQDTSPVQWEIVDAITEEFFAGQSTEHNSRTMFTAKIIFAAKTIFAVGDQKQSIFSFQGAEPEMFSRQREKLDTNAKAAGMRFEKVELDISFRSTRDVLRAVDKVFSNPENSKGLQDTSKAIIHEPNRQSDPGEVIIWPMIESPGKEKQVDWLLPVDHISEDHPSIQLAKRIATTLKEWIDTGAELPGKGRKITYGDILILVRKRDQFASAITRELKYANLSVAGADRLSLTSHIAIEDLLSLGKWALFPEDDLALAEVLKNPLFGFDDDDLMKICIGRADLQLWQSLCLAAQQNGTDTFTLAHTKLAYMLQIAQTLPPYEFYSEVLSTNSGRKLFKARLGDEVDDVLDAFLLEALNHSVNGGSGLQEFISSLETASPDIKREVDLQRDEIRVMTVHSAKGLEAPIVFLVDPGSAAYNASHHRPQIIKVDNDTPFPGFLWQPSANDGTSFTDSIYQKVHEKAEEEYRRLLYVGMTRAEDKLVICGYANTRTKSNITWHQMVSESLSPECETISDEGDLRWTAKHALRKPRQAENPKDILVPQDENLPDWIFKPAANEIKTMPPLAPSHAAANLESGYHLQDADNSTSPMVDNFALERGNATHFLLQILPEVPEAEHLSRAMQYLNKVHENWSDNQRDEVFADVTTILTDHRFSNLFTPASRAELSITGVIDPNGLNRRISGQIDRIAVSDTNILIVDYKTDRAVPGSPKDISAQYLVQLAMYQQLVENIYPGKPVNCALLWTSKPELMEIPKDLLHERLDAWLAKAKFR